MWAAENGHDQVVRILSEWNDLRLAVPHSKNQTLPAPTLSEECDWVARIVPDQDDADSDKVDHAGEASLPPPDNSYPVTEPSMLPQSSSMWPLKFPYPPGKSETCPSKPALSCHLRSTGIGSSALAIAF